VPPAPGVLCAEGLLAADLKAEFHRTLPRAGHPDEDAANALAATLLTEAEAWFGQEQVAFLDRACETVALMRYEGQGGELPVPWTGRSDAALVAFAAAHQALYGFALDAPVELVTIRIEATGRMPNPVMLRPAPGEMPPAEATRTVHFRDGPRATPVYARIALGAGCRFAGPAIVSQLDATTLVPPGWSAEVDGSGALLLRSCVGC